MLEKSLQTQRNRTESVEEGNHLKKNFVSGITFWSVLINLIVSFSRNISVEDGNYLVKQLYINWHGFDIKQRDCGYGHDTNRFLSIKKSSFIKLPTLPGAFIPDNVIMSITPMRCTIRSALFSPHYTATEGSHNSEVIDYVTHCCRPELSPTPLLSLHYLQNLKSSL